MRRPSCTRQSYLVRQYTTSCRRYARSVPYCQPAPAISSGQRTRSSLARRSASVASEIRMEKGVSSKTISRAQRCLACFVYGLSYVEAKLKADDPGSAHSPRRTGIVKVNVEPIPTALFTQIRPPWSPTNFRHKVSLSPVPSTFFAAVPHLLEFLEDLPPDPL